MFVVFCFVSRADICNVHVNPRSKTTYDASVKPYVYWCLWWMVSVCEWMIPF